MKKNSQYFKSKKRVLKYRQIDTDKVISAIRIATEVAMSAIQLQIAMSTPRPKFQSGGVVGESGREMVTDSHGDVLLSKGFNISPNKFHLLNHKTEVDKHWDKLLEAMSKTTSMDDSEIMKHYKQ